MHQFKCVANAINVHEFTFNILSFIHLLLNNISIVSLHSQIHIKLFPFHYFNYVNYLFSILLHCFVKCQSICYCNYQSQF